MNEHLSPGILNALVDGELSEDQLATANQHLAVCAPCTSNALHLTLLKSATAKGGRFYTPAPDLQERLTRQIRQEPLRAARQTSRGLTDRRRLGFYGWAGACALLSVCLGIVIFQQRSASANSEFAALATEVCDQHIATLAANAPPQVISSDRHTVKPWFQGKLPFSFNLPDDLPSGITLDGANLTYIHNKPAAQLLYSVGKHRASIYLEQRVPELDSAKLTVEHSGFHIVSFSTNEIDGIAVSDADPTRLSDLVTRIAQVQK
jgi:anti-sigma factor RsiW